MTIKEQLKKMLEMQDKLNANILKEFGKNVMTREKLNMAIIDELGELTHELKGNWCWWKKTQKPVDRKRVLEELVDVYHFVMTWELEYVDSSITTRNEEEQMSKYQRIVEDSSIEIKYYGKEDECNQNLIPSQIGNIITNDYNKLPILIELSDTLKFSFDEIYQEYLNKNKINYERLENGY